MSEIYQIRKMITKGWIIDEIKYDRFQGWFYLGATHETGTSVTASSTILGDAFDELYENTVDATPDWYLEQLNKSA